MNLIPAPIGSWDQLFMTMAYTVAMKSKDPKTKLGAIVVGHDHEVRSLGYNSYPTGLNDNVPERQINPEKRLWVAHAERNAIYNAAKIGVSLKDCIIYTPRCPCPDCAIAIVQSGIKKILLHTGWPEYKMDDVTVATTIFQECGVELSYISCDIPALKIVNNSVIYDHTLTKEI